MDGAMSRQAEVIKRIVAGEIEHPDPSSDPDQLEMSELSIELPLFLDAMLFSLRIQADSYAKLVTFFYPGRDIGRIASRSFNEQRKWFANPKQQGFDDTYTSILLAKRKWFDDLAGEDGLRDVVTHQSGIQGVAWSKPPDGPIKPLTSLYRSSGVVEEDVFGALQEITAGWFNFLDEVYRYFVPRFVKVGILPATSIDDFDKTRWFDVHALRGLWVYPVCEARCATTEKS